MRKLQLNTTLNDAKLQKLFMDKLEVLGMTKYKLTRLAVEKFLEADGGDVDKLDDFIRTGNFEEDVKRLDLSGITTKELLKELHKLDANKKEKNAVKKGGAFHEENAVLDIKSIVNAGRPDYLELKYHFEWWDVVGLITNTLARRGHKMSKRNMQWLSAFHARGEGRGSSMFQVYDDIRERKNREYLK